MVPYMLKYPIHVTGIYTLYSVVCVESLFQKWRSRPMFILLTISSQHNVVINPHRTVAKSPIMVVMFLLKFMSY